MKKLISIALALCLVLSAFAFGSAEGKSVKICMKRILFVAAPASVRLLQT